MRRPVGILMVLFAISEMLSVMAYGHGGDTTKIHSCVNKSSGEVKIVGANALCKQHEMAVDWPITAPSGPVPKVLTEISLVSDSPGLAFASQGEVSRFLWEPGRYAPPPAEIFLEVVASVFGPAGESATFRLHDVTNDLPITGSSFTFGSGTAGRLRTADIASSFPLTPAEIALVVERTAGASWLIRRSAVLVQQ
ncbi:MAG: hypothetical protein HYY85_11540 [Deltaproteobacteria bacterium]|nr:hypothetical protein [Deltaproteobacteria bacterium]